MDNVQNAPEAGEVVAPKPVVPAVEKKEETLGETFKTTEQKPEPKMVPESDLLAVKKQMKKMEKDFRTLQEVKAEGATKKELKDMVSEMKTKWPDNSEFIDAMEAMVNSVKPQAIDEDELDEKIAAKVKPLKAEVDVKKLDAIFDEHYDKTLEAMPEYKSLANKAVIKALALNPENANKTFGKIMEEAYGHLVEGKATLDKTKPGSTKQDPASIDYNKAAKDPKYFAELMADPSLKKEYNASLEKRLRL